MYAATLDTVEQVFTSKLNSIVSQFNTLCIFKDKQVSFKTMRGFEQTVFIGAVVTNDDQLAFEVILREDAGKFYLSFSITHLTRLISLDLVDFQKAIKEALNTCDLTVRIHNL